MSYLGKVALKASDIKRLNVTSSTSATHTLTWTPPSEQSLIITINGVKQQNNYSISGVTLTLDTALVATDEMEVIGINDIGTTTVPGDDTVTTDKIQDDAVTADKLASGLANATHTGDATGATVLTIAADAVTPAKMADSAFLANRNMIINGAMQINQRLAVGSTVTTTGIKSTDRWGVYVQGAAHTQGVVANSVADTVTTSASNALKQINTSTSSATSTYAFIQHIIEAQDIRNCGWDYNSASSYVTLSFWVKSSLAGTFYCVPYTNDGTAQQYPHPFTLSAATWTNVSFSMPGNANLTFNNDNGTGLKIDICAHLGTDWTSSSATDNAWQAYSSSAFSKDYTQDWCNTASATWELTAVQLEVGSTATPFEHKPYGQELFACQRYWQRVKENWWAYATSASVIDSFVQFIPDMRAAPSVTLDDNTPTFQKVNVANVTGSSSSITASSLNTTRGFVRIDGFSGLTSNSDYLLVSTPFYFDAEL